MTEKLPQVLLVADSPEHIVGRIGCSWTKYASGVAHQLVTSSGVDNYTLQRRGAQLGLMSWLDTLRFLTCGSAVEVPQAVTVHHVTDDMQQEVRLRLHLSDATMTASEYWKQQLESWTGRQVHLAPYALNTDHFTPPPNRNAARYATGIKETEFVLGFVGKAGANRAGRKGVDLLLSVLQAARANWDDLVLALVGPGWDEIAISIEAFGVRVLRFQFASSEDTVAAYAVMDALLVTSSEEGGPCTILEAMACRVPVVSSRVGHVPEVICDGKTGFICMQRTPAEYVNKLKSLRHPQVSLSIANAARDWVVKERDERIVIPKIDFAAIYAEAEKQFMARSNIDRFSRRASQLRWRLRHTARNTLMRAIRATE